MASCTLKNRASDLWHKKRKIVILCNPMVKYHNTCNIGDITVHGLFDGI